jgi:hypothetical protein
MGTGMDDQLARCEVAEFEGWGKVLKQRTPKTIQSACQDLILRSKTRLHPKQSANGADKLTELLVREMNESK